MEDSTIPFVTMGYLALVNVAAFCAFARDKQQARRRGRRTSEVALLSAALIGGWPGAKFAQRCLRHKTRKQPFGRRLNLIGIFQLIAISALAYTRF